MLTPEARSRGRSFLHAGFGPARWLQWEHMSEPLPHVESRFENKNWDDPDSYGPTTCFYH